MAETFSYKATGVGDTVAAARENALKDVLGRDRVIDVKVLGEPTRLSPTEIQVDFGYNLKDATNPPGSSATVDPYERL